MMKEMSSTVNSEFSAVEGFFEHDQDPEGPNFRAVCAMADSSLSSPSNVYLLSEQFPI